MGQKKMDRLQHPQIYWEIGHPAADYITLTEWWDKNAHDIHLYIGQGRCPHDESPDLTPKMELARSLRHVKGNCFWPANEILWNNGGIADSLREHYHRNPALIPAYTHMYNGRPKENSLSQAERTEKGYTVKWFARGDREDPRNPQYFVIYRFFPGQKINLNDPTHIVAVTPLHGMLHPNKKFKCRYVITAVDPFPQRIERKKIKVEIKNASMHNFEKHRPCNLTVCMLAILINSDYLYFFNTLFHHCRQLLFFPCGLVTRSFPLCRQPRTSARPTRGTILPLDRSLSPVSSITCATVTAPHPKLLP